MTTRRERQRTATLEEIKSAALRHITEQGAAGLSIRGLARDIGMSPAGLYRYFDGLDDIVTALLVDAYADLADAVAAGAAGPGGVRQRLRSAAHAYRTWAVTHSNRFLLIFGTPIPGYAAPEDGPTVQQNRRLGAVFLGLIAEGHASGEFHIPPAPSATAAEEAFVAELGLPLPADRLGPALGAWAAIHGMVTLEVLHQLAFLYPDAEPFFTAEVDRIIGRW